MLEVIIIAGIAYLILRGSNLGIPAATTPVIYNATGGSLSNTLGNTYAAPSTFATGAPGYLTNQTPPSVAAGPSAVPSPVPVWIGQQPGIQPLSQRPAPGLAVHNNVLAVRPVIAGTRVQPLAVAPTQVVTLNPATQTKVVVNPALTAGVVSVARNSPEVASPFWTSPIRNPKLTTY